MNDWKQEFRDNFGHRQEDDFYCSACPALTGGECDCDIVRLESFIQDLLEKNTTQIEVLKRKSGTRTNYICPKCRYFGGKGTFCVYDRRKLVEETESWEEPSDEYYNQAIQDVLNILRPPVQTGEGKHEH